MPVVTGADRAGIAERGAFSLEVDLRIDFTFTDHEETWSIGVRRGVPNARRGPLTRAQLTVSGPKAPLSACCSTQRRGGSRARRDDRLTGRRF